MQVLTRGQIKNNKEEDWKKVKVLYNRFQCLQYIYFSSLSLSLSVCLSDSISISLLLLLQLVFWLVFCFISICCSFLFYCHVLARCAQVNWNAFGSFFIILCFLLLFFCLKQLQNNFNCGCSANWRRGASLNKM